MDKGNLEFRCEIPHHEDSDARLNIQIEENHRGPVMMVTEGGQSVNLTRAELDRLADIFRRYDDAKATLYHQQAPTGG